MWCSSLCPPKTFHSLGTELAPYNHGGGGRLVAKSSPTLATLWTVARQAPLSMGFSRQGYWSGLPLPSAGDFPNPGTQSCLTLCDPTKHRTPGLPIRLRLRNTGSGASPGEDQSQHHLGEGEQGGGTKLVRIYLHGFCPCHYLVLRFGCS